MAGNNKTVNNKGRSTGNSKTSKTTSTRSTSQNSKGKNSSNNQYTKDRKTAARAALVEDDGPSRKNEIYVFVYLAVTVFLICSNFGWCGVVGDFISKILFG